jgi:hypothetical protein
MAKRVYFVFDYLDVSDFRANVVRNSNVVQGTERAGFYDASIWEEAEKQGPLALKRLINKELEYTSVTAVLIGSRTYERRWVRYEIIKSVERGNSLIGIHINSILDKTQSTKPPGPNPFDHLAFQLTEDGLKAKPTEWRDGKWVWYSDLEPFAKPSWANVKPGTNYQLSHWVPVYDWTANDGYNNFGKWI